LSIVLESASIITMIDKKDVHELSLLARLHMSEEEEVALTKDIDTILGFVEQIKVLPTDTSHSPLGLIENVMRDDEDPFPRGEFTERLLKEASLTEGGYIKVKKIL